MKLTRVGLFATRDNLQECHDYLAEAMKDKNVLALYTAYFLLWNTLADKYDLKEV